MGHTIGEIIFHAVGVMLSPFPLIAVIIVLAGARKRTNGPAFAAGFVLAVAVALAAFTAIFAAFHARRADHANQWTMWVRLAIGVALIGLAAYQVVRWRSGGPEASTPGWLRKLDEFGPVGCAGLAAALAVADPKNLSQIVATAVALAGDSGTTGARVVAGAVFVVIGSLCVLIPLAVHLFGGDTATVTLNRWKAWMVANDTAVLAVLLLVLGAKSLGEAITGLTS